MLFYSFHETNNVDTEQTLIICILFYLRHDNLYGNLLSLSKCKQYVVDSVCSCLLEHLKVANYMEAFQLDQDHDTFFFGRKVDWTYLEYEYHVESPCLFINQRFMQSKRGNRNLKDIPLSLILEARGH